jgi:hypothetical protein
MIWKNAWERLVGKPEGKRLFGRLGADGSIILEMNLNWWGLKEWTGFSKIR